MLRLQRAKRFLESREFLLSRFSIADCAAITGTLLVRLVGADDLPFLRSYFERLTARPAWSRVMARKT